MNEYSLRYDYNLSYIFGYNISMPNISEKSENILLGDTETLKFQMLVE